MLEDIIGWGVTAFSVLGWVLYLRENQRYRDAITDLSQVMYDHDLGLDDLRRTEDHKKMRDYWE